MCVAQWPQPGVSSSAAAAAGRAPQSLRGSAVARAARAIGDGQGWTRALQRPVVPSMESGARSALSSGQSQLNAVQGPGPNLRATMTRDNCVIYNGFRWTYVFWQLVLRALCDGHGCLLGMDAFERKLLALTV